MKRIHSTIRERRSRTAVISPLRFVWSANSRSVLPLSLSFVPFLPSKSSRAGSIPTLGNRELILFCHFGQIAKITDYLPSRIHSQSILIHSFLGIDTTLESSVVRRSHCSFETQLEMEEEERGVIWSAPSLQGSIGQRTP